MRARQRRVLTTLCCWCDYYLADPADSALAAATSSDGLTTAAADSELDAALYFALGAVRAVTAGLAAATLATGLATARRVAAATAQGWTPPPSQLSAPYQRRQPTKKSRQAGLLQCLALLFSLFSAGSMSPLRKDSLRSAILSDFVLAASSQQYRCVACGSATGTRTTTAAVDRWRAGADYRH